jgi:diacylglycerol O-acyltransferase
MGYERLTATDASFLHIETPHEPQHVGSLTISEGGPLRDASGRIRIEDIRATVEGRLHRVPRMRQRVRMVPLRQGRPVWVDDHRFDIAYHVRLTALPRPGDHDQLLDLMGRLQSLPLDRERPLWELWIVDGLADGKVAQIIKIHHAIGDGLANVDIGMALVDLEPDPPPEPRAEPWQPPSPPSDLGLLRDAVAEQLRRPVGMLGAMASAVAHPGRVAGVLSDLGDVVPLLFDRPRPASWNTQVSAHRRWVDATASIDQVRRIRRAAACDPTLNDVVLAACTLGLRGFMADHAEDVGSDRVLKAMVPVSVRGAEAHGDTLGNLVSLIIVDLPVHEPDPVRCLEAIRAQTSQRKGSGMADGAGTIVQVAGAFPVLAPALAKVVSRTIPMNLVITNIPGPPVPLYSFGARILAVHPYVEVIDGEGLTIAVLSYEGVLHFGLTADLEALADLPKLAGAIERAFSDLESALG